MCDNSVNRIGSYPLFLLLKLGKSSGLEVIKYRGIGLCGSRIVSLVTLFTYAKVWRYIRDLAAMDNVLPTMHDILLYLRHMANKRTVHSIFGKIILAASSYYIWLERNNRVFKNVKKTPEDIRDIIMVTVRLKLLTFRFKNTTMVNQLLSRWKMPINFRLYG
ncbi:hypothetical protein Tco_1514650 [Tanacetum coccineum]